MATTSHNKPSLFPLLSLLCFISIFLLLSLSKRASLSSPKTHRSATVFPPKPDGSLSPLSATCDFSEGSWIYDPNPRSTRYTSSCKEIFKGWNCIRNNKTNGFEISNWRWKPKHCDLPSFDPLKFLQSHRNTNIANAKGGELESLGFKEGYRVDVDIPDSSWAKASSFHDILILNTGHWWWAPSKFDPVKSPMLFFEGGRPILPPIPPATGLDRVLNNMVNFVEKTKRPGGIIFFRTQSPRHFEGGDWDQGGTCQRLQPLLPGKVEEFFSVGNNGTNVEVRLVNQHLYNSLKSRSAFHVLDITRMSEYRADAHPAAAGGKNHDDCIHWCLPGLTDTWNDLFVATLHTIKAL